MFNLEQLLHPVSAVSPCGGDITFSQELDAIARARQHDDPSLDQGEWVTALKEADWPFVATRCEQLIAARSKDLRVAVWLLGTDRYIGLGIPTIVDALQEPLPAWDFLGKMAFTIVSLGTGFKGGEVTPLFFIGATLGNALGPLLHRPVALLAAIGFVAVFAGAANTPIASTLMAMELFGAELGVYAAIACVVAYLFSGHAGIYRAQRSGHAKRTASKDLGP